MLECESLSEQKQIDIFSDRDQMKYQLGNHDTVEELGSLVPRSTARSQGLNRAVTTFENGCKRAGGVETRVTTKRHALTNQPVKI